MCTYCTSDNNGAGYKDRADYATLTCGAPISFPRDFYEVSGDTVTFRAPLPSYPYAFMCVQVKPWEREAEGPIRHVVVGEGVASLPKYMLEGMPDLETVRVPAAVKEIGSRLPKACQVYIGGIRIPDWFLSHDGILVRVREDVEEIRITGEVRRIGRYAFEDCLSLKRVIIPESVLEIEEGAFAKFDNMLTICCEAAACPASWQGLPTGEGAPTVIWGYEG